MDLILTKKKKEGHCVGQSPIHDTQNANHILGIESDLFKNYLNYSCLDVSLF